MKKKLMAEKVVSETRKWEAIWGEYVRALSANDAPVNRAHRRLTRSRLEKAMNAVRDYDYDFYLKIVVGNGDVYVGE